MADLSKEEMIEKNRQSVKKTVKIAIFTALFVFVILIVFASIRSSKREKDKKDAYSITTSVATSDVNDVTSDINALLSDEAKGWLADRNVRSTVKDNELSVNIRVISPDAIGIVAESALSAAEQYSSDRNLEIKMIYIYSQTDKSDGKREPGTLVSWNTTSITNKGIYNNEKLNISGKSCSIDDLYEKYNNIRPKE
ncbi:MAG: hypothetical protein J5929_09710 [Eubacterium sp.]|nr:hypothetical protein [Eubacterium sp.]